MNRELSQVNPDFNVWAFGNMNPTEVKYIEAFVICRFSTLEQPMGRFQEDLPGLKSFACLFACSSRS